MRRSAAVFVALLLVSTPSAIAFASSPRALAANRSCTWTITPTADPGHGFNALADVSALSVADTWAVGWYSLTPSDPLQTLIEHWDGTSWTVASSPSPGAKLDRLQSVSAVSSTDVWAVGSFEIGPSNHAMTLTEHWDGASWTVVPSPNQGKTAVLESVSALSADDAWAVGSYDTFRPLVEHWDGTQWSIVPNPDVAGIMSLEQVVAVAPHQVWAAGWYGQSTDSLPLAERWNGHVWSIVPAPVPTGSTGSFKDITIAGRNDLWAVGYSFDQPNPPQTLAEHWDGTAWAIVDSPDPGDGPNYLDVVAAFSRSNVLALGLRIDGVTGSPLTERWDGSAWSVDPDHGIYLPNSIDPIPGMQQGWVVGSTNRQHRTLAERVC